MLQANYIKGIELAIHEYFPGATQRRCVRHLYSNFKQSHPGIQLRSLFWAAARACNAAEFKRVMELIKTARPAAHEWMMKLPLQLWAKHKFNPVIKVDHLTNNFTESFNNWVGDLRGKPIISLLDGIRSKMMARIRDRFEEASSWEGIVTKNTRAKLESISQESRKCSVLYAGGDEYEVLEKQTRFVVYVNKKTCSCGHWDISGIPCKHGAACLLSRRMCLENFCDPFFSKAKYMETYERIIHPILDETMWDGEVHGDPIQPPKLRRLLGRPRKNRRREEDEVPASTSA